MRERTIACLAAMAGIALTGLACRLALGDLAPSLVMVAPLGASAVLLFAVPASPLAQPWPIIGGNVLSAATGFLTAAAIPDAFAAAGLAVGLAIAVMSLTRCLHPPGGAAALTAVLGGPAVAGWDWLFPLVPVGLNSCLLVGLGILAHRMLGRTYPHFAAPLPAGHGTADPPSAERVGITDEDIDAALAALGETYDIDRADLGRILKDVELRATLRSHGWISCAAIMSRDVISVAADTPPNRARSLLLHHNIRVLPVLDGAGRLLGTVGLRELESPSDRVGDVLSPARIAAADAAVLSLLPVLTDGATHAVMVTDREGRVEGVISQTDLLSAMGRLAFEHPE
ncbi:MAG: HPP family protein [Micropepsaceae bacterium]